MKLKTKYKIGDKVKYNDEEFVDNGTCKCCKSTLMNIKNIQVKGIVDSINIRIEQKKISIEYEINNDFIDEKQIIKKLAKR